MTVRFLDDEERKYVISELDLLYPDRINKSNLINPDNDDSVYSVESSGLRKFALKSDLGDEL